MGLYLTGQVRRRGCAVLQHSAVQPDAVVEEICRVVMVLRGQTAVSHDYAVDDLHRLPEAAEGGYVFCLAGRRSRAAIGEDMEMGIDDFHGWRSPFGLVSPHYKPAGEKKQEKNC